MTQHGQVNQELFRFFENSINDSFSFLQNNLMDSYYTSTLNKASVGTFPAVVLSGITTNNNTGTGTHPLDGYVDEITGQMVLIVKPLINLGSLLPDPLDYANNRQKLLKLIEAYGSVYLAKSTYDYRFSSPIAFGQKIECNFSQGNIVNSDFRGLTYTEPSATEYENGYTSLLSSAQDAAVTTQSTFRKGSPSVLGTDKVDTVADYTKNGLSSNIVGDRTKDVEFIVIHYSAAIGSKKAVLNDENTNGKGYGYHIIVDRNGTYYESAPLDKKISHCGGNDRVYNSNSIGLALCNVGYERTGVPAKTDWVTGSFPNYPPERKATRYKVTDADDNGKWEPYSAESLKTAAVLAAKACREYDLWPYLAIVGHSDIQDDKQDPGPAFDLDNFRGMVATEMNNMGEVF